jgi:endoglucanase
MIRFLAFLALLATPAFAAPQWGVNIAGGEFGSGSRYGYDYLYPQPGDITTVKAMGAQVVRVPVQVDRVAGSMAELRKAIADDRAAGLPVIIDLHAFGTFLNRPRADRIAFLKTLLLPYKSQSSAVMIELDNEPVNDPLAMEHADETITDLRNAGFRSRVLTPSRGWSGVQDFVGNGSAGVAAKETDTNTWTVVHWYGDDDNSGTKSECDPNAADRLDAAIATGLPLAITEAGAYDTPTCRAVLAKFKAKVNAAPNVKLVTWWGYARWFPETYPMALRKQDGTVTRLFHCLMWVKGVCP